MAAAALTGHTVDRAELVRIATEVEAIPITSPLPSWAVPFAPLRRLIRSPVPALRGERSLAFYYRDSALRGAYERGAQGCAAGDSTSTAVWQMGRIAGMTRGTETGDLDLIAAANDDRIQSPIAAA